jgi:hypothetical protein
MIELLADQCDSGITDCDLAEIRRRRADPDRKLVSHDDARARIKRLGT